VATKYLVNDAKYQTELQSTVYKLRFNNDSKQTINSNEILKVQENVEIYEKHVTLLQVHRLSRVSYTRLLMTYALG